MPPNQQEVNTSAKEPPRIFFCSQNVAEISEQNLPTKPDTSEDVVHKNSFKHKFQPISHALSKVSSWISETLENGFEKHGRAVGSHPIRVICACLFITAICSIGLLQFHMEIRPFKLWLAQDSNFIKGLEWQFENFPIDIRQNIAIWEADNVLDASVVQAMWQLHKQINNTRDATYNKSWDDVCMKIPSLVRRNKGRKRNKRPGSSTRDVSLLYDRQFYCNTIQHLRSACLEKSLLEVWGLDEDTIMNLTNSQIVQDVNAATISAVFGFETNFSQYLGNIKRDENGTIISAGSAIHTWMTAVNKTLIEQGQGTFDPGTGFEVDLINLSFESSWIEQVLNTTGLPEGTTVYANAASSFGIISEGNINGDVPWIALGFALMFGFVTLTIGRRNLVEQRSWLAFAGIFAIMQSVVISYGLCSALGMFYTPVNSILPVLMVGLGVDDMFVIMSSWESLKNKNLIHKERLALTMRHAGVAITVTSITDVVAFAVGSTTSLPALRSFCTFAAVGVMSVYLMQITFFVSFLIYDEKRIEQKRNSMLPCIVHENWTPSKWSQKDIIHGFFEKFYVKFLLSPVGKCITVILALLLIGVSSFGSLKLYREFDPMWFLPPSSYLSQWHEAHNNNFPENSNQCFIFVSGARFPEDFVKSNELLKSLEMLPIVHETTTMVTDYLSYFEKHPAYENYTLNSDTFSEVLSLFLNSRSGAAHRNNFYFDAPLTCNDSAPPIKTIRFPIKLSTLLNPVDQEKALVDIQASLDAFEFTGYISSWGESYMIWETNAIVGTELTTNLTIVTVIIFVITVILLASLPIALLVLGCVMGTMLSICGLMFFWGLTIDTVSCIAIVLSVGLSIDYAVHIAHAYLVNVRQEMVVEERVNHALLHVGPAVFLGGTSTLITFMMMAPSTSHVFVTFFKVFVGSATFGLFWGLAVLPVVLDLITMSMVKGSSKVNRYQVTPKDLAPSKPAPIGKSNDSYVVTEDITS